MIYFEDDDARSVNWSNGNAAVMFELLGLGQPLRGRSDDDGFAGALDRSFEDHQFGETPVADVRRAILRARATLERRGPHLERPASVKHGPPRENADGTIELRPITRWVGGLDVEGMRTRLDAFERCVNVLVERGATHITWG